MDELSLTVLGQAVDELKIGVTPFVTLVYGDGAVGESRRLTQFVFRCGQEHACPSGSLCVEGVRGRSKSFEQGSPGAAVFLLLAEKQAKLGVPIPNVVLGRIGLEGRFPRDPRCVQPPQAHENGWRLFLGPRAVRVERGCRWVIAGARQQ